MLAEKVVLPAEITSRVVEALASNEKWREVGRKMSPRGSALSVSRENRWEDGGREGTR